jgi:hypothetical protein
MTHHELLLLLLLLLLQSALPADSGQQLHATASSALRALTAPVAICQPKIAQQA